MVAWLAPAAFTLATAAVLLSCGGGSVRTTPLSPLPSATLIPIPSATPVTVVEAQTVGLPAASAGATPAAVQLPAAAGFATTLFLPLPQTAANAQLTTLVSNFAPAASPPFSLARTAAALSRAMSLPRGAGLLLYVDIYSSAVLALPAAPGFTLTVPPADVFANANYYLALFDPTRPSLGWQYAYAGPATAGGGSALALTPKAAPFTLAASLSNSA